MKKLSAKLQLSSKRIYFYLETLQDLAQASRPENPYRQPLRIREAANAVAVTYAPVPSFQKVPQLWQSSIPFPWLKNSTR